MMRRRNVRAPAARVNPPKAKSQGSPPVAGNVLASVATSDVTVLLSIVCALSTVPTPVGAVLPDALDAPR